MECHPAERGAFRIASLAASGLAVKLSGLEVDTPKPWPSIWQRAKNRKVGVQSREASCNKVTETKGSMSRVCLFHWFSMVHPP